MSFKSDKYDQVTNYKVIKAYLRDGLSHRRIQSEILKLPAPTRGWWI